MRRADRLFQIVQYLRGGRLVTARQLAEKLEPNPLNPEMVRRMIVPTVDPTSPM